MKKSVKNLKIYLLDINYDMTDEWRKLFEQDENVEIVCAEFADFMRAHKVGCVVSPANAFGLMDGGYDAAISEWFGRGLQKKVQQYIIDNLYGEQPVGTSIIVDTDEEGVKLIHTPSMRTPEKIIDPVVVYQCMRTCLMTALDNGVESIVIPAFGGCTGRLPAALIAKMMRRAYEQLCEPPSEINWRYAHKSRFMLL